MDVVQIQTITEGVATTTKAVLLSELPSFLIIGIAVFLIFMFYMYARAFVYGKDDWPSGVARNFPRYNNRENRWEW